MVAISRHDDADAVDDLPDPGGYPVDEYDDVTDVGRHSRSQFTLGSSSSKENLRGTRPAWNQVTNEYIE